MKTTLDLDKLARELGVKPPPLPLSAKGQEAAAVLLEESSFALTETREKLARLLLWGSSS